LILQEQQMDNFVVFEAFEKTSERLPMRVIDAPIKSQKFELRTYQELAFKSLRDNSRFILSCPTGWGKTKLLQFLAVCALKNTNKKILVTVPQHIIGKGFVNNCSLSIDGEEHRWGSIFNCCGGSDGRQLSRVRQFLDSKPITNEARICVTTHAAIVRLHNEDPSVFCRDDIVWVIDECHHARTESNGMHDSNMLGEVVKTLCGTSSWLWLTTATYGRADYGEIIAPNAIDEFITFHVPFDEYWDNLRYLRSFKHRFVFYENDDLLAAIDPIIDNRRTLVYCPQANSRFLLGDQKSQYIDRIRDALLIQNSDAKMWYPRCRTGNNIILDLTEDRDRDSQIRFLYEYGDRVYAVLAVSMMREGADWPMLEHVIDLAPVFSSMPLRIQKFGRGTRDYPDKHTFTYTSVLPRLKSDDNSHRERCNDYFGQLMMGLVDSMYYSPSKYWPTESPPKLSDMQDIARDVYNTVVAVGELMEDGAEIDVEAAIKRKCGSALPEAVLEALQLQASIILKKIGFNRIKNDGIIGAFQSFCTGVCDSSTFAEMRQKLSDSADIHFIKMLELLRVSGDISLLAPMSPYSEGDIAALNTLGAQLFKGLPDESV